MSQQDEQERYSATTPQEPAEKYSQRAGRWGRRRRQPPQHAAPADPSVTPASADAPTTRLPRYKSLLNAAAPAETSAKGDFAQPVIFQPGDADDAPALPKGRRLGAVMQRFSGSGISPFVVTAQQERRARAVTLAVVATTVAIFVIAAFLFLATPPSPNKPGTGVAIGKATAAAATGASGASPQAPTLTAVSGTQAASGATPLPATAASQATASSQATAVSQATAGSQATTSTGPTAVASLPPPTAVAPPPTNTPIPPTPTPIPPPPPGANLLTNPSFASYGGWCVWNNTNNTLAGCDGSAYTSFIEGAPAPTHRAHYSSSGYNDVTTYQYNSAPVSANYYASLWVETTCDTAGGSSFFLKNTDTGQELGNLTFPACLQSWTKYTIGPMSWGAGQSLVFEVRSQYNAQEWVRFYGATLCYSYGGSCA